MAFLFFPLEVLVTNEVASVLAMLVLSSHGLFLVTYTILLNIVGIIANFSWIDLGLGISGLGVNAMTGLQSFAKWPGFLHL